MVSGCLLLASNMKTSGQVVQNIPVPMYKWQSRLWFYYKISWESDRAIWWKQSYRNVFLGTAANQRLLIVYLCITPNKLLKHIAIRNNSIPTTFPIQLYLYNPVELSQNQWWPWHSMVSLYRVCVTNTLKAESKMVLILWEKSVLSRPPPCRDSSTHTSFSNKIAWFTMPRCLVLCLTSLGHDGFIDHAVYCRWQHTNRRRWLSMAKQQRLDHKQPLICSLLPPSPFKFVCRRAIKLLLYVRLTLSRQMLY